MKIALCAIGKPNTESMDEWIRHHLELGIDHIYVYNDGTATNILDNVNEDRLGHVSLETVLKELTYESSYKVAAYADCFRRHKEEYDWIAYFDIDQYLSIPNLSTLKDILSDPRFQDFEVVRLNTTLFSDRKSLAMDFNMPFQEEDKENDRPYVAKSIVNCKAFGFYFTENTIQRNGAPITQCLPNLKELPPSDTTVDSEDLSVMYLTSNMIEMQWIQWKRDRGFW